MGWLTAILSAAAAAWGWKTLATSRYRTQTLPESVHYVVTADGWRLALNRYRPKAPIRRRHPVIVCHGLGSSHVIFDLLHELSLSRYLASRGFDVWVLDLRGHGFSERPGRSAGRKYDWTFDDYLMKDLPAAISFVLRETGATAHHWVGHSMGGLLLYAHLAVTQGTQVRSGVTLGSSLDYSASRSEFLKILKAEKALEWMPVFPMGIASLLLAPLTGRIPNRAERFNVHPTNIDGKVLRRLMANGYSAVPMTLLRQMASAMRTGGLSSLDGKTRYLDTLSRVETPVLAIAGKEDRQCPPEAVQSTLETIRGTARKFQVFGRGHGQADDYGHSDLLIGKRAPEEVYPVVASWLENHDA